MSWSITLTPGGQLLLEADETAEPKLSGPASERLQAAFAASAGAGLELLAGGLLHEPLPPSLAFWRELARRYFTAVCHNPPTPNPAQLQVAPPAPRSGPPWWRPRRP